MNEFSDSGNTRTSGDLMKRHLNGLFCSAFFVLAWAACSRGDDQPPADKPAAGKPVPWARFPGGEGPGKGKRIVLIAADQEYRCEEVLPQLAKILSKRHGFDCTVLFQVDPDTGFVNARMMKNIPGLEHLQKADLLVAFMRFQQLPDEQMQQIDAYLKSGRPVLGIRTSTHAFASRPNDHPWAHYGDNYSGDLAAWEGGFGRVVLGERWISHHGEHKHQSTRGFLTEAGKKHPVLRGIRDGEIWGPTDVYTVRLPLPGDSEPLVLGQTVKRVGEFDEKDALYGMRETDREPAAGKNDPMLPIVWTKTYQIEGHPRGQSLTTTIGSSTDFLNAGVRRLLVNGVYSLVGLSEQIPAEGTNVDLVGEYQPTSFDGRSKKFWEALRLEPAALE